MKLSEAMKLGAMLKPQAHGTMFAVSEPRPHADGVSDLPLPETVATCALGAAFEAIGAKLIRQRQAEGSPVRGAKLPDDAEVEVVMQPSEWNIVLFANAFCPECGRQEAMHRLIPHLNDDHMWTRESIAQVVEIIEGAARPGRTAMLAPESANS